MVSDTTTVPRPRITGQLQPKPQTQNPNHSTPFRQATRPVTAIRRNPAPIYAGYLQPYSIAFHLRQQEMIGVVAGVRSWSYEMIEGHLLCGVYPQILTQVWFAAVRIQRRPAPTGNDVIEPVLVPIMLVALDPVLEQVLVSAEENGGVMTAKQRHVSSTQGGRRRFDYCAPVRSGGERRMMKEGDDVLISLAIEAFQLRLYPFELFVVVRNV